MRDKATAAHAVTRWSAGPRRTAAMSRARAVSQVRRQRRTTGEAFQFLLKQLMQQVEANYEDWPEGWDVVNG